MKHSRTATMPGIAFALLLMIAATTRASSQESGGEAQWCGFFDPHSVTVRLNLAVRYYAIRFSKPSGWARLAVDSVRVNWQGAAGKTVRICFWPNSTSDGSTYWPVDPPSHSDIKTIYDSGFSWNENQWNVTSLDWKTDKDQFFVGFEQVGLVSQLCADGKAQPENRSYRRYEGKDWEREYSFISNYCIEVYVRALTAVGITGEGSSGPTRFFLYQNYPNPFNPATTISFAVPRTCHVTLKIHNMLGREVAQLVNAELPPGLHSVQWNSGSIPSGVYFYRLQAGSFNQTRQLILVK
jgi:hypothetical protein